MSETSSRRTSSASSATYWVRPTGIKRSWIPHALPTSTNFDDRPVWEPPLLNYSHLIDVEVDSTMRDAVMEYTDGDIEETTKIMDIYTELDLLDNHYWWAEENQGDAEDEESARFFQTLRYELNQDLREVQLEEGSGLARQPRDGLLGDGSVINNPMVVMQWNYRFKSNPDGTMVFLGPMDLPVPQNTPVASEAGEDEEEGKDGDDEALEASNIDAAADQL